MTPATHAEQLTFDSNQVGIRALADRAEQQGYIRSGLTLVEVKTDDGKKFEAVLEISELDRLIYWNHLSPETLD